MYERVTKGTTPPVWDATANPWRMLVAHVGGYDDPPWQKRVTHVVMHLDLL